MNGMQVKVFAHAVVLYFVCRANRKGQPCLLLIPISGGMYSRVGCQQKSSSRAICPIHGSNPVEDCHLLSSSQAIYSIHGSRGAECHQQNGSLVGYQPRSNNLILLRP